MRSRPPSGFRVELPNKGLGAPVQHGVNHFLAAGTAGMEAESFIDQRWPIGALPVCHTQVGNMNPTMSRIDDRDRAVLDRLEVGQTVTPETIKKLYRHHTDVRRSRTLRRRVEDLLHQPEFEDAGFKRWKYRGTG